MTNQKLAEIIEKMDKMSNGERAVEYEKLSSLEIEDSIAGILAFHDDHSEIGGPKDAVIDELTNRLPHLTEASKADAQDLLSRLKK